MARIDMYTFLLRALRGLKRVFRVTMMLMKDFVGLATTILTP